MRAPQPIDQAHRDRIHGDLDATLFVEAGAGAGKTRELIERILRLVVGGRAELRGVAAITFTEAAAAELRDRVRMRLEQASQDEASHSADERARCATALREVDAAAIETLHAFAQRILASHPIEAGLPPLIEVQDEIRASIAFRERWDAFFEDLLEDPGLEDTLVRAFSLGLTPVQLRKVAWEFHNNWDRLEGGNSEDAPHLPPVDVSLLARALADICAQMPSCTDTSDRLYQHLEAVDQYRRRLENAATDIERLRILAEKAGLRTQGGQAVNWRGISPSDLRDALKDTDDRRAAMLRGARQGVLPPLLAALRRFVLDYADERRRQGRLEFHDLLVQCRNLLYRDAAVRRAVQARFSHILIDEFQDTDPLQIEIAVLLAADPAQEPQAWHEATVQEGRLFFVGDPKQSIYRFRRADIALYQRAQARFAAGEVRLTESFRSLPPVTEWVNGIIGPLLADDEAKGQATYVALHPFRQSSDAGATHVTLLGGPKDGNVGEVRDHEAREIAQLLFAVKAGQWTVFERDADGNETSRAATFQDVAILIPTRTTLPPIEHALEQAGIPYRVESQSLVYSTQEVQDLLSILRCIDDPTDEVALIAALRSPAFACADDDLLRFARARGRWDYRLDPPDSLLVDDPVVAALRALHVLHRRRWWETISGIVEAVIRERRLFELAFAHRRPREHWQRLRFVLDQTRAFAEAGGTTLRQFIDWAEHQKEEGTRVVETVVPEPDDDAVRIMTVHAAKGLEFPIVLLAGLNTERTRSGEDDDLVLWDGDGRPEVHVGGKSGFATPGYETLAEHHNEMERQEKIRLLYVAATRACDHLIVSLHHRQDGDSHAKALFERCAFATDLWRPYEPPQSHEAPAARKAAPFEDSPERRDAWVETRQQRIAALARAPFRSATDIARAAGDDDDPNVRKDVPVEEVPPWRRGRAGTAFGRAVHAVLQSIDMDIGADVTSAAHAQAAAEGIAARADDVARAVSAALGASCGREAVANGRDWRELYVAALVEGTTVEGFVDLLYETPVGLVVVDYKTDLVPSDAELDAALARYRLQGAAYALGLQEALGRAVVRCVFVFAQPGRVIEREVDDLPAAVELVRSELATPAAAR
ncbi:MAG: UvrD-helicase domain-containing protein [Dehalococcoidia bacterium]